MQPSTEQRAPSATEPERIDALEATVANLVDNVSELRRTLHIDRPALARAAGTEAANRVAAIATAFWVLYTALQPILVQIWKALHK